MRLSEQAIFLTIGTVYFLASVWAVRRHFASTRMPPRMIVISILWVGGFVVYVAGVLRNPPSTLSYVALVMQCVSLIIFVGAVRATRAQRLTLAGDDDTPTFLTARGPYRWIRHPFYTSYLIYWAACAIQARSIPSVATFVAMACMYFDTARSEEAKFLRSELADTYRQYRKRAGMFWPIPWARP